MRLLDLGLDRYGPFTDRRLIFRPDAKLHIVHGANEAGKSCSLAAVTDLLFGIERQTAYDFLHAGKELRLTAKIRDGRGETLSFRRRKNKPQITDLTDAALPDDALAACLGGMARPVFLRAFGLNAEALRRSSEELKQSDGELGAALFSAASGLRGFADLQKTLESEADAIYADRRANSRLFYQALDRFDKARRDLRDHETRSGDLKKLRDELAERAAELESLRARRAEIALDFARLDRLRRAQPILAAIDEAEAMLAALGDVPDLPQGYGEALLEAVAAARRAQAEEQTRATAAAALEETLAGLSIDPLLLDASDDIEALRKRSGEYAKAMRDLPAIERDHAAVADILSALARRLGLQDVPMLLARQPDDASRARVSTLLEEGAALKVALHANTVLRESETASLEARRAVRQAAGLPRDPKPFAERLAALADAVKRAEAAADEAPSLAAEGAHLGEAARRLCPPVQDLDRLAATSFPTAAMIKAFAARTAASERNLAANDEDLAKARTETDKLASALAELSAEGPVPTPEAIAAARQARDLVWSGLSDILLGAAPPEPAAMPPRIAAFERALFEADRLADTRASDATRVAAHGERMRQMAEAAARIQSGEREAARLQEAARQVESEWRAQWGDAGVDPLDPADMQPWRAQIDDLLARRERWRERDRHFAAMQEAVERTRPAFDALVRDLGLVAMPDLPIPTLARRLSAEVEAVTRQWNAAREDEAILVDLEKRAAAALSAESAAQDRHALWRRDFMAALPRIGLPDTADETEAATVLDAWRDVPAAEKQLADLRRRIDGIHRDARQFESDLQARVTALAPDLDGASSDAILQSLALRTRAAREARVLHDETRRRFDDAKAHLSEARDAHAQATRAIARLLERAPLPADADLARLGTRLASRDTLRETLERKRAELANAADGRAEHELREALANHDPDTADREAARLSAEDRALDRAGNEVFAAHRDLDLRLRALEGAVEAEVAAQQRRSAEAELVEAARDWAVLSLGARMIATAIERQRVGRQEPLMMRAADLFAMLTGGAYAGLGQEYDDDTPHLVGRRSSGATVRIADMSEGTRDQLYLALRLAYVEDYAGRAEPPPFLGDDLFASFDDERTAHGLRALAAIGGTVQPILFTHHRFVVETARRELGDDVDILSLGELLPASAAC